MQITYSIGADRIPIRFEDNGSLSAEGTIPFHGIVSRGLRKKCLAEGLPGSAWQQYAHLLWEDTTDIRDPQLSRLQQFARESGTLTFVHSLSCVSQYVEAHFGAEVAGKPGRCELWNLKEGHTSSVWRILIHGLGDTGAADFVLNVARDAEAGLELAATAETMQRIAAHCPGINMAKVTDITAMTIDYFGEAVAVPVTRNEFVPNALEVHRGTHRVTGVPTYVLVERFVTNEARPAEISSIRGRVLSSGECEKLESDVESFLGMASECVPVAIDINDGDVVWDGERALVVAI